jgi:DUF971 family protein
MKQRGDNTGSGPGTPAQIIAVDSGAALEVSWPGGRTERLEADLLWRECPSAAGKRRRMDGRNVPAPGIAITKLQPIGGYGVNIGFSDGHDRGIYTWAFLADLAARPGLEDFLLPKTA